MVNFKKDWHSKVRFEVADASENSCMPYRDSSGKHFTHIYSYNKVMTEHDRMAISKRLNRTNFRTLTWFFDEKSTTESGLMHFKLVNQMRCISTGK